MPRNGQWDPLEGSTDGKRYVRNVGPKSDNQARLMEALRNHHMVVALGPADTRKMYLAVTAAVVALAAFVAAFVAIRFWRLGPA